MVAMASLATGRWWRRCRIVLEGGRGRVVEGLVRESRDFVRETVRRRARDDESGECERVREGLPVWDLVDRSSVLGSLSGRIKEFGEVGERCEILLRVRAKGSLATISELALCSAHYS
ncbi:hypothetical protein Syun_012314 [Stephania yunnanensis]|uniref:Uncharacterized protein n=1 Tax=Stephania yunnanensis TaxID=152371 RepID=A0AAP0PHE4_9MAGN